jgi:cytochrome c oxidase assembly protein subunit 11
MSQTNQTAKSARNYAVLGSCVAVIIAMIGMCYAAVPLYYVFCRATGYAGTPSRAAAAPGVIENRIMTVRFDTNVDPELPWSFAPEERSVKVKVGEERLVFFRAQNKSNVAVTGHAAFNVQPDVAARYFTKIQCFCFTEQRLEPGESVEMPVTFFISPGITKDRDARPVSEMTLSYTFYPSVVQSTDKTTAPRGLNARRG